MTGQDNGSARQAVARLVAELGRAKRAIERGDLTDAREALAAVRALDPGNLQAQALEERCRASRPVAAPAAPPVSAAFMEQAAWLSFEQRVRERRARRCEQAAEAAMAAGSTEDAIAAIDELALVLPSHPRIAELRRRAASPVPGDPVPDAVAVHDVIVPDTLPESLPLHGAWSGADAPLGGDLRAGEARAGQLTHAAPRRSGFSALLGALAVLCVAFAAGSWWWVNREVADPDGLQIDSPREAADASGAVEARVPPTPAQPEPAPAQPVMADDTASVVSEDTESPAPPAPVPSDAPIESAVRHPPAGSEPQPRERVPALVTAGPVGAPLSQTRTPSDDPPTPLASVAAPIGTAGNTATAAAPLLPAGTIQPLAESLPPRPAPAAPPAAAAANTNAPIVDPAAPLVAGVRQVLDRYAQGYSSRQAAIVRQVWPEVDARALERAFGQLDSQDVRFDECRIEAAEAAANATCTGMASWVPAVGDRSPRRQPRTWRFALAREGQGWIITQARVAAK